MKCLIIFFCAGFALASAAHFHNYERKQTNDILDSHKNAKRGLTAEFEQKLKEKFDGLLEKLEKAIKTGKLVKEDTFDEINEFREFLRYFKIDLSDKAKELIHNLKEMGHDYLNKVFEKLGFKSKRSNTEESSSEFEKKLKGAFNHLLNELEKAIKAGKGIKEETVEKLHELGRLLRLGKIDLSDKTKELLRELKKIGKDYYAKLLERLGFDKRSVGHNGKSLDEVTKELKKLLNDFLAKIKDAIKSGQDIKDGFLEKLNEIREKFKNHKIDMGKDGEEISERLKEVFREYFKYVLNKLGVSKRDLANTMDGVSLQAESDPETVDDLKEKFFDLLKKVSDGFENGKSIVDALDKLQKMKDTLKLLNIDVSENAKEYLEKFKNKVKDYWNKLRERLNSKRSADIDVFGMLEELKKEIRSFFSADKIREILEKVFTKGSELLKELRETMKEKGDHRKEKILNFIDRILEDKDNDGKLI